ncbi:hypothetical protein [Streptomyces sp. NPDC057582]|uniref:MmyB family transcriptional regulator n=1 Tax=Streptomyces sp. NPDC057582 TaxID=3346174 RepID=UPI003698B60B
MEAGRHPQDKQLSDLVGELTLHCPEFSTWWNDHRVLRRTHGTKYYHHPLVTCTSPTSPSKHPATSTRPCASTTSNPAPPPSRPSSSSPTGPRPSTTRVSSPNPARRPRGRGSDQQRASLVAGVRSSLLHTSRRPDRPPPPRTHERPLSHG